MRHTYIVIFCILLLFVLCASEPTLAQHNTIQNKQWVFGRQAGLNFNSGSPVPFLSTMPGEMFDFFSEAGATVCDGSGNILFYTDGRRVFNRAGFIMQNGDSIVQIHTNSTAHGTFIVPVIGNSNQYYVFSLEQYEYYGSVPSNGRLAYSLVDMSLDSGFGGVVPTSMGIYIDSVMTEKMAVIPGSNCNMWVVTHLKTGNLFYAFSVSSTGVSSPVISTTGSCTTGSCYFSGGMKVSNDGHTLATGGSNGMELHDFNPFTGVVYNSRVVNTIGSYGMEFSPDDSKLYFSEGGGSTTNLVQIDISLPTVAAIMASRVVIATGMRAAYGLKLAPDNKIYMPAYSLSFLDCISNPNLAGAACGYIPHAVTLLPGSRATVNMPSLYRKFDVSVSGGGAICPGGALTVTPSIAGGVWTTSSPSVATVAGGIVTGISAGSAEISYTYAGCTDVANVTVVAQPDAIGGKRTTCIGYTTILSSTTTGGTWASSSPGIATINAVSGIVTGLATGTTIISYTLPGGCPAATTTVSVISSLPPITASVTSLCIGDTTTLSNSVPGGMWLSGTYNTRITLTTGLVTAMSAGASNISYTIGGGCFVTMPMVVITPPVLSPIIGPTTVCQGSNITLTNPLSGGTWSSSNSNATITSAGTLTGINPGTSTITYKATNICGADSVMQNITIYSTAHCDSVLEVSNVYNEENDDMLIFPNPTQADIHIESHHNIGAVAIYNTCGQNLFSGQYDTSHTNISLAHLPRGIYIVRLRNNKVYRLTLQ